jgi:hypothetical protein
MQPFPSGFSHLLSIAVYRFHIHHPFLSHVVGRKTQEKLFNTINNHRNTHGNHMERDVPAWPSEGLIPKPCSLARVEEDAAVPRSPSQVWAVKTERKSLLGRKTH